MNKSMKGGNATLLFVLLVSLVALALAQRTTKPNPSEIGGATIASPPKPVMLNCIPMGGTACDEPGDNCLVMFPWDKTFPGTFRRTPEFEKRTLTGNAYVGDGARPSLHYEFTSLPAQNPQTFPLKADIPLDRQVAQSLGYSSVTILKGTYEVDRKKGKFGGVVFALKVAK